MSVGIKISHGQFESVIRKVQGAVKSQVLASLRDAAIFGQTEVQKTINRTRPTPAATGAYRSSWFVDKKKWGAVLSNSTLQAFFVEKGRRPGKGPPLAAIEEWVRVKRLDRKMLNQALKRRRAAASASPRKTLMGWAPAGAEPKRRTKRTSKKVKARYERLARYAIARAIQRKIAARGTDARQPLGKSIPKISRYLRKEIKRRVDATRPPKP